MSYVVVSACLAGDNCKYNGGNNFCEALHKLLAGREVIRICSERVMGIPRPRVELRDGRAFNEHDECVDEVYRKAVDEAVSKLAGLEVDCCILQSRSPTCGVNHIYDGTFSGKLIQDSGMLAKALVRAGYTVYDVEDVVSGKVSLDRA